MSETTIFLVRFLGPAFLIIGCSILLHQEKYAEMLKEMRNFTLSFYLSAVLPLCAGLAVVLSHNLWSTLPEASVSVIGWGGLLKGALRLIAPATTRVFVGKAATPAILFVMGVVVILWGGYMTWIGYFTP